ncbi:MAG: GNAT family N-acetyltransferase [Candidatus Eisenbacteria bacterium]
MSLPDEYEITSYHPRMRDQSIDLLRHLLGPDASANRSYFEWKYERNPYTETPAAIVALRRGDVAGFRGYFATRWRIGGRNGPVVVLCPGDTCVHPEHRRVGLSVAMGRRAMQVYAHRYPIFLNLTAGANSTPGYLRMGFVPVEPKTMLYRYGGLGLLRFLGTAARARVGHGGAGRVLASPGRTTDLLVSDRPRPEEMLAIAAARPAPPGRLSLDQDQAFFRWRFDNPRSRYRFYYWRRGGAVCGYAAVGISRGRRGRILDLLGSDEAAAEGILERIVAARHFDVLSVERFHADHGLEPALVRLGFRAGGVLAFLERRMRGVYPVLVRPVREDFTEEDWRLGGLDIRQAGHWALKGICADDA